MNDVVEWLKGRKTYFVAAAAILTAFAGWLEEQITLIQFIEALFIAIGGITLRAGMKK